MRSCKWHTLYNQRGVPSSQLHSRGRRTNISFFKTNRIGSSSQTMRSASGMKLMLLISDSRLTPFSRSWRRKCSSRHYLRSQCEELEVAHAHSQNKFTADLQMKHQEHPLLQDKLERISVSHNDISQRYETDVITVRWQASLCHRMTEEINNLQQNILEKEGCYERKLEELKTQLNVQISLNLQLSTELQAEREYSDGEVVDMWGKVK